MGPTTTIPASIGVSFGHSMSGRLKRKGIGGEPARRYLYLPIYLMVYFASADVVAYPAATAIAWIVSVAETVTGPMYFAEEVLGVVPSVV